MYGTDNNNKADKFPYHASLYTELMLKTHQVELSVKDNWIIRWQLRLSILLVPHIKRASTDVE
jgi:hypothetical protein